MPLQDAASYYHFGTVTLIVRPDLPLFDSDNIREVFGWVTLVDLQTDFDFFKWMAFIIRWSVELCGYIMNRVFSSILLMHMMRWHGWVNECITLETC